MAVTGTILAFASQVLLYGGLLSRRHDRKRKLLRHLIVRIARLIKPYRVREVEVVKEIEKEKIVYRDVEVPTPVNVHHTKYRFLPVPGWDMDSDNSPDDDD